MEEDVESEIGWSWVSTMRGPVFVFAIQVERFIIVLLFSLLVIAQRGALHWTTGSATFWLSLTTQTLFLLLEFLATDLIRFPAVLPLVLRFEVYVQLLLTRHSLACLPLSLLILNVI